MDNIQKGHITKHLAQLVEDISPSTLFLSILQGHDVLSTADLAQLKAILDEHEKTNRLLYLLMTRPNAYDPLILALRKTSQAGVASVLEQILPSTSKSEESASLPNSETYHKSKSDQKLETNPKLESDQKLEADLQHPSRHSSFQSDHNNNDETSFNRNILRFISKSQASSSASLMYSMSQSPETILIKIIHTLDTYITSHKLSSSKDISIKSVYYPFHHGETFTHLPNQVNIVTLTTTQSLLSLLHDMAHFKNLKAVILTSETLEKIQQTVDDFKNSINYPTPAITTLTDEIKWTDLTPEGKEHLLNKTVKFQEEIVRLGDLHNDQNSFEKLGSSFIISLLYGGQQPPDLIRKSAKVPPENYISRHIHPRSYLLEELLNEANSKHVFLVSGMPGGAAGLKDSIDLPIPADHSTQQRQLNELTAHLISLDQADHFEDMWRKAGSATVYWFQAHTIEGSTRIHLEFKQAHPKKADLSLIQNWADKGTGIMNGIEEESFIDGVLSGKESVCIADVPGMGKSALLFKAAERIKQKHPGRFVHYSTMPDFIISMKQVMERREIQAESIQREHIIEAICESATNIVFEKKFLAKILEPVADTEKNPNSIRCELMLDGLDEIVVEDQNSLALKVINKIKTLLTTTRLWLTCRHHMVRKMENQLHVLGCSLSPFSTKNQVDYLVARWIHKELKKNSQNKQELSIDVQNKFRLFAHTCLKNVKQNLESHGKGGSAYEASGLELAGNPLQCRLIAGNYFGKASSYATSSDEEERLRSIDDFRKTRSITELYQAIVQKKWVTYLKKNNMPDVQNRYRFLHDATATAFIKQHMELAFKIIFPKDWSNMPTLSSVKMAEGDVDLNLASFGILSKSSKDSLEFVHRTYAEYFVARFIVDFETYFPGIPHKSMAEFVVRTVLSSPNCEGGFLPALWFGRLENPPYFNHPLVVYFLNDMLGKKMISEAFNLELKKAWNRVKSYQEWTQARPPVFMASILCNHLHIAKLYYEALDQREKFRKLTKSSHEDMISLAAEWSDLDFVKFISEDIIGRKVRQSFNSEDRKVAHLFTTAKRPAGILKRSNLIYTVLDPIKPDSNPLYAALSRGEVKIAEYLIEKQKFGLKTWQGLQSRHKGLNVIHVLLRDSWEDNDIKIRQKQELLKKMLLAYMKNKVEIINEVDEEGRPPILQPRAHVHLIECLIDWGADVFIKDEQGNTLLHLLCDLKGFLHYRKYERDLNKFVKDGHGYECNSTGDILEDAKNFIRNYQKMKERDEEDKVINVLDVKEVKNLQAAYHIAVNIQLIGKVVETMVKVEERHGAAFDKGNNLGATPLHNAVLSGNLEVIQFMVSNFEEDFINTKDKRQLSPLCYVTLSEPGLQMEITNYFLHHAGANIRTNDGIDPVLYGLQYGIPDDGVLRELERKRFPPGNIKDEKDENKMLVALFKNRRIEFKSFKQHLEWILDGRKSYREFIYEDVDEERKTSLLHLAIQHLSMERFLHVVKELKWLKETECVNAVDWEGNTALHLAYLLEDDTKEMKINFLEKIKADRYIPNMAGKTPNDYRKGISKGTIRRRPIADN
ncbi:unnamed protein product [Orchesella dallaii]|uniref:NACHT domain-containing protein n=1 Tax=Orchesella dallaii TaxID=48710 RepID=A0ABP1PI79_9HEXA